MGRKTKLTRTVQEYVCTAIRRGANDEMRARNGRISKQTYYTWLNRGAAARQLVESGQPVPDGEQPFLDFLDEVEDAQADYGFTLQQVIADEAERSPAEARRELQRLYPQDYAPPPTRAEVSGPAGGPLKTEVEHRGQVHGSVEHVAAVVAALAGVGAIQLAGVSGSDDAEDDGLHTP